MTVTAAEGPVDLGVDANTEVVPLRIFIVNQYAVPPSRPGGTRHHALARELGALGHDVTLICSDFAYMEGHSQSEAWTGSASVDRVDGVRFCWLPTPAYQGNGVRRLLNMTAFAMRTLLPLPRELGRPDVIVGSSPHLLAAAAAERLARRFGVPFVLEVRDVWPQSLVDLGGYRPNHPVIRALELLERHLYRSAARVVTVLPEAWRHVAARGGRRETVDWIPNGVDLCALPASDPPPDRDEFTFLYAGAHGLANHLEPLIDAAQALARDPETHHIRLRFMGDGPVKAALRTRAASAKNVIFDPPRPKAEVYAELAKADAFMINVRHSPLYRHGISPNKLNEYLAAGRPIVMGGDCPANPVTAANAGIIADPDDPRSLARAMRKLAEMPHRERVAMGARGSRYARTNHDFAVLARRLASALSIATLTA